MFNFNIQNSFRFICFQYFKTLATNVTNKIINDHETKWFIEGWEWFWHQLPHSEEPVWKKNFLFLPFTKGEAGGVFYLEFTPKSHKNRQISPIIVSSNEFPHSLFNGGISKLTLLTIPLMLSKIDQRPTDNYQRTTKRPQNHCRFFLHIRLMD